jgi:shikimate kinase
MPDTCRNLYLIGLRGSGKSAVGKRLSAARRLAFCDMDVELGERFGRSIEEFVQAHGWAAFRSAESSLLKELSLRRGLIVSTGGGVVLNEENIVLMRRSGRVVWLRAEPDTLIGRLRADTGLRGQRPPLAPGLGPAEEIRQTLAARAPLYRRAMDWAVDTEGLTVAEVCAAVQGRLDASAGSAPARLDNPEGVR